MLGASILDMPKVPPGVGEVLVGLVGTGWRRKKDRVSLFEHLGKMMRHNLQKVRIRSAKTENKKGTGNLSSVISSLCRSRQ